VVYQFWQAQRKDEVQSRAEKIGCGRDCAGDPVVHSKTTWCCSSWHNTWERGEPPRCLAAIVCEVFGKADEASFAPGVRSSGSELEYLRFIKDDKTGEWRRRPETSASWPKTAKELRLLSLHGSGHFVAAELPIPLLALRMAEEGLSWPDAVEAVLQDNLFGLRDRPALHADRRISTWRCVVETDRSVTGNSRH